MKIRFCGQKIEVRPMADDEIIGARCLFRDGPYFGVTPWRVSSAQGDHVGEHPHREYVEILSTWFKL